MTIHVPSERLLSEARRLGLRFAILPEQADQLPDVLCGLPVVSLTAQAITETGYSFLRTLYSLRAHDFITRQRGPDGKTEG